MKKSLLILGVVAAYSLFEAGLLLSILQPNFLGHGFFSKYDAAVFFGQLVLIPAFAALFSRLLYGPYRWPSRALRIIFGIPTGIVVSLLAFLGFALAVDWIFSSFGLNAKPWIESSFAILFSVAFIATMVGIFFIGFTVSTAKSVALESERWLRERRSGADARQRKWRNRGIRWALWTPALLVLLIFFFLPESEHAFSTLRHPKTIQLGNYKVPVPGSWLVLLT